MGKETFTMEVSIDLLEKRLLNAFKISGEQHYKLLAKIITGNLKVTEVGMQQLYLAFSGHEEIINFLPGDEVLVEFKKLYTWGFDEPSMVEAGLIVNGMITAKVIGIQPYKTDNVQIEYMRISSPGAASTKYEQCISQNRLMRSEKLKIVTPDVGDLI